MKATADLNPPELPRIRNIQVLKIVRSYKRTRAQYMLLEARMDTMRNALLQECRKHGGGFLIDAFKVMLVRRPNVSFNIPLAIKEMGEDVLAKYLKKSVSEYPRVD